MELTNWQESSEGYYHSLGAIKTLVSPGEISHWRIVSFDTVSSTMDVAKQWDTVSPQFDLQQYLLPGATPRSAPIGCVAFVAREQRAGRGRQGNSWLSGPDNGLYVTLLWKVNRGVRDLAGFSIAAGTVVAESLDSFGLQARCKWPNDIVIDSPSGIRKLGGLLIESWKGDDESLWVSAGIGINLAADAALAGIGAVAVEELGVNPQQRGSILGAIVARFSEAIDAFSESGLAPFLGRFEKRSVLTGKSVDVMRSGTVYRYVVHGVSSDGGLRVKRVEGNGLEEVLYAGEVSLSHAYCR